MEQDRFENAEKNFRTDEKELLETMKPILSDFFICELSETKYTLLMRLANGQVFSLTLKEV